MTNAIKHNLVSSSRASNALQNVMYSYVYMRFMYFTSFTPKTPSVADVNY